jgi:hypothetical protein
MYKEIVRKYNKEVAIVANFLLEREVLVAADMIDLIGPRPWDDEVDLSDK